MLEKYLKDDIVLVIPDNLKKKILEKLNNLDNIFNLKIMSLKEVINALTFTYDEKTIYYLISNYHYKYDIALMYLENIKYVDNNNYHNKKIDKLVELKEELTNHNLLIYKPLLADYLKKHQIVIYGYDYLSNYQQKILQTCNYEIVKLGTNNYKHKIYEFNTIEEEIEYVAIRINELIKQGININNIKIANINNEYFLSMLRIFALYNIPLEDLNNGFIYSTAMVQDFLSSLDINTLNYNLNNENNRYIYDAIINVLNKYLFVDNLSDIKEILKEEFKKIKNKTIKRKNEIRIIDINNNIIEDSDYIFYMNFNQGNAPLIVRDEDYLNDNEKRLLGLEDKNEINNVNKKNLKTKFSNIKNMEITYKLKSSSSNYEPSFLNDELKYEVKKDIIINYNYSHKINRLKLASYLDQLIKYQDENDNLKVLFSNYSDIPYCTYDNSFKGIIKEDFYKYINNKISLSYSSIDNYYRCQFRFYLNNILKIDREEDSFVLKIGNIFHSVLENIYKNNVDFEVAFKEAISSYELTSKEIFFSNKLKDDLKFIVDTINYQNTFSILDKTLCEERVYINKDNNIKLTFTGVIDKLLYKEKDGHNYVVIIDYKTGNPNINLNNVYYGINMQLPIYIYLAKNISKIKDIKIVGFYLQKILHSKPKKDNNKDLNALKQNELKLEGYSNSNLDYVAMLDNNYENSKVIKGFKLTTKGTIDARSHVLSDVEINKLVSITEKNIDKAFKDISNMHFAINPKQIDNENIGCAYCKYKDICFKKENDIETLPKVDYKDFLKEGD